MSRNNNVKWGSFHFRIDNQKLWYCDSENNVYSHMDLDTGVCEIDTFLPADKDAPEWRQYGAFAEYKNKLVFAPENAASIIIYDRETHESDSLLLDEKGLRCHEGIYRFCGVEVWKQFAYLFPCNCTVIVRIDMETLEIKYIDQWYKESKADASQWTFCQFECRINDLCFLPFTFLNKVLCFHLETEEYEIYEMKDAAGGFASMHFDGQYFWLAALFKPIIYRWDKSSGIITEYVINAEEKLPEEGFLRIMSQKNELILVPFKENYILSIDKENGEPEKKIILPEGKNGVVYDRYFSAIEMTDDGMLAGCSPARECMMKIHPETGEITEYEMIYNEADSAVIKDKVYQWLRNKNYGICFESKILELNELIHIADNSGNDILKETQQFHTEDVGKNIFEYLKKHIS